MRNQQGSKPLLLGALLLIILAGGIVLLQKEGTRGSSSQAKKIIGAQGSIQTGATESQNKEGSSAEFYYQESSMEKQVFRRGSLQFFYVNGRCARSVPQEGEKSVLMDVAKKETLFPVPQQVIKAQGRCMDPDGNYKTVDYDPKSKQTLIRTVTPEGKECQPPVVVKGLEKFIEGRTFLYIREMRCDAVYTYLHCTNNSLESLCIIDRQGEVVQEYPQLTSFDLDTEGNGYLLFHFVEGGIYQFDGFQKIRIQDGTTLYRHLIKSQEEADLKMIRYSAEEDLLYVVDRGKITTYQASDGKERRKVFTFGEDSSFFPSSPGIRDLAIGKQGELFLIFPLQEKEQQWTRVYTYQKMAGQKPKRREVCSVTAPYRLDFLEDAIALYQRKHPGETIRYEYAYDSQGEYMKSQRQYGQQMAVKVMAGDMGDIVVTGGGGFLYRTMFATDAFEDLKPLLEKDPNYENLNKNVLKAITIQGAIRGLPVSYIQNFNEINMEMIQKLKWDIDTDHLSWSQVLALAKTMREKDPKAFFFAGRDWTHEDVLIRILNANMLQIVDFEKKQVDLHQEWFVQLLRAYKEAVKSQEFVQEEFPHAVLTDVLRGCLLAEQTTEARVEQILGWYASYNQNREIKSRYIPEFTGEKADNRVAYTNNMYSINPKSKNKEKAWEFLSCLLEEETQALSSMPGQPLNQRAYEANLQMGIRMVGEGVSGESAKFCAKMLTELSTKVDYLYDMDYFKQDIYDSVLEYVADDISLEEALKKAERNVWIRLNE